VRARSSGLRRASHEVAELPQRVVPDRVREDDVAAIGHDPGAGLRESRQIDVMERLEADERVAGESGRHGSVHVAIQEPDRSGSHGDPAGTGVGERAMKAPFDERGGEVDAHGLPRTQLKEMEKYPWVATADLDRPLSGDQPGVEKEQLPVPRTEDLADQPAVEPGIIQVKEVQQIPLVLLVVGVLPCQHVIVGIGRPEVRAFHGAFSVPRNASWYHRDGPAQPSHRPRFPFGTRRPRARRRDRSAPAGLAGRRCPPRRPTR
jgi:hypothetical protein